MNTIQFFLRPARLIIVKTRRSASWIHSYFDHVMTKQDRHKKTDVNLMTSLHFLCSLLGKNIAGTFFTNHVHGDDVSTWPNHYKTRREFLRVCNVLDGKRLASIMKRECSPNSTSSLISYTRATIECLERSDDAAICISGGVFNAGKLTWLARGAALEVVNTKNGFRKAAWRFGRTLKSQRAVCITSVAECPMEDGAKKLVVGLKDMSGRNTGMVCLFDPYVSRVVKAIEIPYPVTVVQAVSSAGGVGAHRHSFRWVSRQSIHVGELKTKMAYCT